MGGEEGGRTCNRGEEEKGKEREGRREDGLMGEKERMERGKEGGREGGREEGRKRRREELQRLGGVVLEDEY